MNSMTCDLALVTEAGKGNYMRLKSAAKERGTDVNRMAQRFVLERAISRLFASRHADRFLLKGGLTLMFYENSDPFTSRATADVDIQAEGFDGTAEELATIMREVLAVVPEDDDGVRFDTDDVEVTKVRDGAVPGGTVQTWAQIGNARLRLKVDVGFDDRPVREHSVVRDYPSMLPKKFAAFPVRCYPSEYSFADKIQAAVRHGDGLSRIRDFYDLYVYATRAELDEDLVVQALQQTFTLFGSDLPFQATDIPPLSDAFVEQHAAEWTAYLAKTNLAVPVPTDFADVVRILRDRIDPLLTRAHANSYGAVA